VNILLPSPQTTPTQKRQEITHYPNSFKGYFFLSETMVRIKRSDHVLKTATKSRRRSLPAALPEEFITESESESGGLEDLGDSYDTLSESADGDKEEIAIAEGDSGK
jgi:hypothetical protein